MFLDFFTKPIPTVHNGTLRLKKILGTWEVHGNHATYQTGRYMNKLWGKVFASVPVAADRPLRILLLGVATGGTFNVLLKRWPNAHVTGVDWEPDLFELGRCLGISKEDPRITFISGDALQITQTLTGVFDFIVVDIFNGVDEGIRIADAAVDPVFQDACARLLAPDGHLALNYFHTPDALAGWNARFPVQQPLRYKNNGIMLYKKLP